MLLCPVSLNFTFMYSCTNQQYTNSIKTKLIKYIQPKKEKTDRKERSSKTNNEASIIISNHLIFNSCWTLGSLFSKNAIFNYSKTIKST